MERLRPRQLVSTITLAAIASPQVLIREQMMMQKQILSVLLVVSTLALSACGQRPESSSSALGAAQAAEGISVRVVTDVSSIQTGGTDSASITAMVTDENNNALAGSEVLFSASSGVLQDVTTITDVNGEVSATLKLPQDFSNQEILVSAEAEGNIASALVITTGSVLDVSGPDNTVVGDDVELVLSLIAGNEEPIANHQISVVSTAGNSVTPSTVTSGIDGRVSVMIGTEEGDDVIQLSSLNNTVSAEHRFEVSQDMLRFAEGTDGADAPVSQVNTLTVNWSSQSVPVANQQLVFSTTAGEIVGDSVVTTDANGTATVQVQSFSSGPARITVEDALDARPSTSVDLEFIAVNPQNITLDASSSRVPATSGSVITATIRDGQGNPVKNQVVEFTSLDLKGGQLNPASARTNSSGIARVTFTAGSDATEIDDVVIQASVKNTNIANTIRLTVVERVVNVTLGTSNRLVTRNFETQYALPFIVQVADGGGAPLENAELTFSIKPQAYYKGYMYWHEPEGETGVWRPEYTVLCNSEDTNGNRILDAGEDLNGNGSLDPQDPALIAAVYESEDDVATIEGGSLSTDATGTGFFEIRYPKSNSLWSTIEVTARAEALGSEVSDSYELTLSLSADDANEGGVNPPNSVSPYGRSNSCLDDL